MSMFDVMIIGFGFGGYVVVICCVQLGMKIVLIEKYLILGGICLNVGCILLKVLLDFFEYFFNVKYNFVMYGIKVLNVEVDFVQMIVCKDEVVV